MTSNGEHPRAVDPEDKENGIPDDDRAADSAFDKLQQYGDADDEESTTGNKDPDEADGEE